MVRDMRLIDDVNDEGVPVLSAGRMNGGNDGAATKATENNGAPKYAARIAATRDEKWSRMEGEQSAAKNAPKLVRAVPQLAVRKTAQVMAATERFKFNKHDNKTTQQRVLN